MFSSKEFNNKKMIKESEDGFRYIDNIGNKIIYLINNRTSNNNYKLNFIRMNEEEYKLIIEFEDRKSNVSFNLPVNRKIVYTILRTTLTMYIVNDTLKINIPNEFDIYK